MTERVYQKVISFINTENYLWILKSGIFTGDTESYRWKPTDRKIRHVIVQLLSGFKPKICTPRPVFFEEKIYGLKRATTLYRKFLERQCFNHNSTINTHQLINYLLLVIKLSNYASRSMDKNKCSRDLRTIIMSGRYVLA